MMWRNLDFAMRYCYSQYMENVQTGSISRDSSLTLTFNNNEHDLQKLSKNSEF